MFTGLFFASAICAHENHKRPNNLFGIISFLYPRPVRLIISAPSRPQLGAWMAFGPRPLPVPVRGEARRKSNPRSWTESVLFCPSQ